MLLRTRYLYLIGLFILFLGSCAKEGPFFIGNLKMDVQVVNLSAIEADLSIQFPLGVEVDKEKALVYVVAADGDYNWCNRHNTIWSAIFLQPETDYTVYVNLSVKTGHETWTNIMVNTGKSFKTLAEGQTPENPDNPEIPSDSENPNTSDNLAKEIRFETGLLGVNFTLIDVVMPPSWNMWESLKVICGSEGQDEIPCQVVQSSGRYKIFIPVGCQTGERIHMNMEFASRYIVDKDFIIDEDNQIYENPQCEVLDNFKDFGIVRFKFPSEFNEDLCMLNAYASQTQVFPEDSTLSFNYDATYECRDIILVPKINESFPVYFRVNASFRCYYFFEHKLFNVMGSLPIQENDYYFINLSSEPSSLGLNFYLSCRSCVIEPDGKSIDLRCSKLGAEENPIFIIKPKQEGFGLKYEIPTELLAKLNPEETFVIDISLPNSYIYNQGAEYLRTVKSLVSDLKWTWKVGEKPVRVENN